MVIRALVKKNLIIIRRNLLKSFFQIFFPIFTIFTLGMIYHDFTDQGESLPEKKNELLEFNFSKGIHTQVKDFQVTDQSLIGIISKNQIEAKNFKTFIEDLNHGICFGNCSSLIFSSLDEASNFVNSDKNKTFEFIIELEYNNSDLKGFNLVLDNNITFQEINYYQIKKSYLNIVPIKYLNITKTKTYKKYNIIPFLQYYLLKFLSISKGFKVNAKIYLYPIENKTINPFYSTYHEFIFIVITLSFICIVLKFSLWVINEKETNITTLLRNQGISSFTYFISWSASYFIIMFVPTILIILLLYYFFFGVNNFIPLAITVSIFTVNIFLISMVISAVLDKTDSAQGVICTLYIGLTLVEMIIGQEEINIYIRFSFTLFPQVFLIAAFKILFFATDIHTSFSKLVAAEVNGISLKILWSIGVSHLFIFAVMYSFFMFAEKRKKDYLYKKKVANQQIYKDLSLLTQTESFSEQFVNRNFEEIEDENLRNLIDRKRILQIENVNKKYNGIQAVKNFSCKVFPGQIFVLLGANGAGKSTLLKLISNIEQVDVVPGKMTDIILYNHSLIKEEDYLHNNLGYCPQEDIFFYDMTVDEHLTLINDLKKKKNNPFEEKEKILYHLGLRDLKDELAQDLAEGSRRRLSLAISLLGNAQLILLDEPTSGMDFKSKKRLWKYLKLIKKDKIIILTTHSLEEAEYLSDVIGIMAEGELVSWGTPSYLKQRYPCGYNINFIFNPGLSNLKTKAELIADLKNVYRNNIKIKILGNDFLKLNFTETDYENMRITNVFERIKVIKNQFNILDYTVSTSTLEDVFLKVNNDEFTRNVFEREIEQIIGEVSAVEKEEEDQKKEMSFSSSLNDLSIMNELNNFSQQESSLFEIEDGPNMNMKVEYVTKDKVPLNFENANSDLFLYESIGIKKRNNYQLAKHIKRLLISLWRTKFEFLLQILSSSFLFIIIFAYSNNTFFEKKDSLFTHPINLQSFFNPHQEISYQYESIDSEIDFSPKNFYANTQLCFEENALSGFNFEDFSYNDYSQKLSEKLDFSTNKLHYLIVNRNDFLNYYVFYSKSSSFMRYQAMALFLEKYLERKNIEFSGLSEVSFWNVKENNDVSDLLLMSSLVISYILFSSYQIIIPLKERIYEVKHINYLCGGSRIVYWIGLFIFDYLKFIIFSLWIYVLISLKNFTYTIPVILLFGVSSITMSYIFSFAFREERHCIIFYFLINFTCSLGMILLEHLYIEKDDYLIKTYFSISDISPFTALRKYFMKIWNLSKMKKEFRTSAVILGFSLSFISQIFLFIFILCLLETKVFERTITLMSKKLRSLCKKENNLTKSLLYLKNLDKTIENEIEKVKFKKKKKLTISIEDLKIKYRKICGYSTIATSSLYLGLENNERFGVMGLNGCGKSSLIKAMINEVFYQKGSIKIFDKEVKKDFKEIRNCLGYCSQKNSLFDYFTVKETFDYYFRGNPGTSIDDLMQKYGLLKYKNVQNCYLSGGNKKKLLFAICLMNNPQIVLLDEPTTGVDPDSRRLMWRNISDLNRLKKSLKENFNLIISTQSFEEAELLCDKIGWMKRGKFSCLGNSEELKLKYGQGYNLIVKFCKPNSREVFDSEIKIGSKPFMYINLIDGLTENHIFEFTNNRETKEEKDEFYFYFKKLDDIIGMIKDYVHNIHFTRRIGNYFVLLIKIKEETKEEFFANLLNLKILSKDISELNIILEPLENFIKKI